MKITIVEDDLSGPEIAAVLEAHLELMKSQSPPESVHALDIDGLRIPEITFWSAWDNQNILGCVALRQFHDGTGEIKSMHTVKAARGRGVAAQMLSHLESHAQAKGLDRLSLETGSQDAFAPARNLYSKFGYQPCAPFADYVEDPNSAFMTKCLEQS